MGWIVFDIFCPFEIKQLTWYRELRDIEIYKVGSWPQQGFNKFFKYW